MSHTVATDGVPGKHGSAKNPGEELSIPSEELSILSMATVFPNPREPGLGVFVRERLQGLAKLAKVRVLAPVPMLDYQRGVQGSKLPEIPAMRQDGPLTVYHPRWFYPPGGTPVNVLCLAGRLFGLARQIRREYRYQVVDAHFGYPDGAAAAIVAQLIGAPCMITFRGNEIKFGQQTLRRWCLAWAVKRAGRVVCVSEELRRFAIQLGARADRVKTIPNGIDPNIFHPRDRDAMRRLHEMPANKKIVLSAGELVERKGHHLIVTALRSLVDAGIDAEVWIAGAIGRDGPAYDGVLRDLIARLNLADRVRLLGRVAPPQLAELMCGCDIFCLASNLEGCPNVVNEALGCGAPVVSTEVGAIPEMIPSEQYGLKTPIGDQAGLNEALLKAAQKDWDRERIAVFGQTRSWDTVALEVLEQLREVRAEALAH